MEDRIIRLEETVALQDKTIEELSDVIADQQQQIDAIERMLRPMANKLHALFDSSSGMDMPPDDAPPHY